MKTNEGNMVSLAGQRALVTGGPVERSGLRREIDACRRCDSGGEIIHRRSTIGSADA